MATFAQLVHHFPAVNRQVEHGLYVTKRTAAYLTKVVKLQQAFAVDLEKVTKHEEGKMKNLRNDAMFQHVAAAVQLQDMYALLARRHVAFCDKAGETVVKPLEQYYQESVKKREKIVSAEANLAGKVAALRSALEKERLACHRTYGELQDLRRQLRDEQQRDAQSKKIDSMEKKLKKARQKAEKQFSKFEQQRSSFLVAMEDYRVRQLPDLLEQLDMIERARLERLQIFLTHFCELFSELNGEMPHIEKFMKQATNLSAAAEIEEFMKVTEKDDEVRNALLDMPDDAIPCSAARIMREDWHQPDGVVAAPAGAGGAAAAPAGPRPPASSAASSASSSSGGRKPPPPSSKPPPNVEVREVPGTRRVRALYAWAGEQPGDLGFAAGDEILIVDETDPSWWTGRRVGTGETGRVPSNYVEAVPVAPAAADSPPQARPPAPAAPPAAPAPAAAANTVRTMYAYQYEPTGDPAIDNLGYLAFQPGDTITVTNRDDPVWWVGTLASNGASGYFPLTHVDQSGAL